MVKKICVVISALALIVGLSLVVFADMQSANYRIPTSVISSGGGVPMSSTNFQVNSTQGQSTPVAEADQVPQSANYINKPAFWYTQTEPEGIVVGSVWFVGNPCEPPTAQLPPCEGLYPNYGISVYRSDGVTAEAQVTTDSNGDYRIGLSPGDYIIYTPAGPFNQFANAVTVVSKQTATLDLVVDTGIRALQ